MSDQSMVPCLNPAEAMHCRCWEDGGPCFRCGDDSDGEDGDECP